MSEIRRIGGSVNAALVQLPERQQPGVVVQCDSLQNLLALVRDARQRLLAGDRDEAMGVMKEVDDLLSGYIEASQP